jgi:hypothetical protein
MSARVRTFRKSVLAVAAMLTIGTAGTSVAAGAGQYESVPPPSPGTTPSPATPSPAAPSPGRWTDLFAYPKGGQSTEQQMRDREECHKWAVEQSGFDPSQPSHEHPSDWAAKRESYLRAEAACLQARNYSVK